LPKKNGAQRGSEKLKSSPTAVLSRTEVQETLKLKLMEKIMKKYDFSIIF
jgi:hypothetical protein